MSTSDSQYVCFWAGLLANSWLFLFILSHSPKKVEKLKQILARCNIFPITEITLWNKIAHSSCVVYKILLMYFLKAQKDFPSQSVFGSSVLNFVVLCSSHSVKVWYFFVVVLVFDLELFFQLSDSSSSYW